MADVKISQLPAATTPVVGTEILPIVQSGITAKVSINDATGITRPFTAKGVMYASSATALATGSALEFDGTNFGVGTAGNTMNHKSVLYMAGAVAGYFQISNGALGLAATNGLRLGVTAAGLGELYAPTSLAYYINNSEQMRLTSTGLGIGTSSPSASAILDAQSTTKGVRMPNMTTTQKNAIASPAAGLMVFDTTLSKLAVYSGTAWQTITSV
jgi:hypothetical protein